MGKIKWNCIRKEHFICQYCWNSLVKVQWIDIYWTDKYPWFYWKCLSCTDVYVWCHKGTSIPLWTVANKELRILRNKLHAEFDVLWKEKWKWRKNSYNWLSQKMGTKFEDTHIAFFNKEQCEKALELSFNF